MAISSDQPVVTFVRAWLDSTRLLVADVCSRRGLKRQRRRRSSFETLEDRTLLSSVTPDHFTLVEAGQSGSLAVLHDRDWDANAAPEWLATFGQQRVTQTAGSNQTLVADDFIAIDTNKPYGLSGWARSGDNFGMRFSPSNQQSFGLEAYDADYLKIESRHVLKHATAADTTLQVTLNPGDTQIRLNSVTGWSNLADAGTRALAWYGYTNSAGFTYPNYTYTRNVATGGASGLWNVGGINAATRVITLNAPWSGPTLPVGTAVRNAITTPVDHSSIALNRQSVPGDFTATEYPALIGGGTFSNGSFQAARFAPGTAFVRPMIQANQHGLTNNFVTWQDVRVQELSSTATLQDVRQPLIDMSVDLPGNQTVRLPLYSTGDTAWHIGTEARIQVSASQRYQLSVDSLDMTEEDLNPVGFYSYDADGKLIHSLHVTRHATAVDTRLARAVQPGDAAIYVNDATGWSNAIGSTAESRSLAWYGYQDSAGTLYADYTYTRNVAFDMMDGLWDVGGITFDSTVGAWKITLRNAWSGPSIASGTAVRNATGHDFVQTLKIPTDRFFGWDAEDPLAWFSYIDVIGGGTWQNGVPNVTEFRPGTKYVQPAIKSVVPQRFAVEFGLLADQGKEQGRESAKFGDLSHVMLSRSRQWIESDELVPVSPTLPVTLSIDAAFGTIMNSGAVSSESHSIGYVPYDSDGLKIESMHVRRYSTAVDTTIAQTLRPGDTQIVLSNAAGWSSVDVAGTRAIAWYGYRDSFGQTYADYTYTRNLAVDVVNGLWDLSGINGNVITLRQPWNGPTLAAGTAVRNAAAGDDLIPVIQNASPLPNQWTSYSATLTGTWSNGIPVAASTPPGTAAVRIAVRANENNFAADDVIHVRNAVVTKSSGRTASLLGDNVTVAMLDVLANDSVALGDISLISVSSPRFGTAQIITGGGANNRDVVRYQSNAWFAGTDQFTYTVRNRVTGQSWTSAATVSIVVGNLASNALLLDGIRSQVSNPSAHDAPPRQVRASLGINGAAFIIGPGERLDSSIGDYRLPRTFQDDDGDVLFASLRTGPGNGTLSLRSDGSFVYIPFDDFVGIDSFVVSVSDGLSEQASRIAISVGSAQEVLASRMETVAMALKEAASTSGYVRNLPAAYYGADGKLLVSWRVHLLRHLGYADLFSQFKLDEPWDSPHNLRLLPQVPIEYLTPEAADGETRTRIQIAVDFDDLTSDRYILERKNNGQIDFRSFYSWWYADSTYSALVVQSGSTVAVPWTAPDDIDIDPQSPLAGFGNLDDGRLVAALSNGSVASLDTSYLSSNQVLGLLSWNDPEHVDVDRLIRIDKERSNHPPLQPPLIQSGSNGITGDRGSLEDQRLHLLTLWLLDTRRTGSYDDGRFGIPANRSYYDANGKPFLSWRVHLLPRLGFQNLYSQFRLTEPWDSPHNLPLLAQMPDIFRSAGDPSTSSATRYQLLRGSDAPWGRGLVDGMELGPGLPEPNTIAIVEVAEDRSVPWTAPFDAEFDINFPLAALGTDVAGTIRAGMFDGAVLHLSSIDAAEHFKTFVTPSGSDWFDLDTLRRRQMQQGERSLSYHWADSLHEKLVTLTWNAFGDERLWYAPDSHSSFHDSEGRPLLSWRTMETYQAGNSRLLFDRKQSWNSPVNLPLLAQMPDVFRSQDDAWDSTTTTIHVFAGPGTPFRRHPRDYAIYKSSFWPWYSNEFTDGTGLTWHVVNGGESTARPWTQPADLDYLPFSNPLDVLGLEESDVIVGISVSGDLRRLSASASPELLRAPITYAGGEPFNGTATNMGSIRPGITVTGTTDARLVISEGELGAVHLVLDKPGNVQIDVALSVNGIVLVDKTTLTFTTSNWNIPQAVTLKAIDDDIIDGAESVVMTLSINDVATTTNEFDALADIVIPVFNVNDDVPTIQLGASSVTLVEGGPAKFVTVSLSHRPASNVTLDLTSLNTQQATISPATVTFTPSNWNLPVNIQLTAVDDQLADGTVSVEGRLSASGSSDAVFRGMTVALLTMTVQDNEVPAIVVSHSNGETVVSEDGLQDTVLVRLGVQPSGDVRVNVFASDNSEVSVLTTTLLFNATNWNVDQAVTLSGVDDALADGDITSNVRFEVAADSAGSYPLANAISVPVKTLDNEDAVLIVEQTGSDTVLSESGGTDQLTVRLSRAPLGTVTVRIVAANSAEVLVGSSSLTFTSANWNVPQSVVLTGVDDALADGDITSLVTISVESNAAFPFRLTASQQVAVRNIDNDVAQLVIATTNGNTSVNESGTFDDLLISLSTQPVGNVVVRLTSSDTGEAVVEASSLTFTAANWNTPQVVRVQGINDSLADGTQAVTMTASVDSALSSGTYATAASATTTVNVIDNEVAALQIAETSGQTVVSEIGSTDTFSVALTSEPIGTVTVRLATDDATEVALSVTSLVFTSSNWNVAQVVTVRGLDDLLVDGPILSRITASFDASSAGSYRSAPSSIVTVTTSDNEVAAIVVAETQGSTSATEAGSTDAVFVSLAAQPVGTVVVEAVVDNAADVSVNPSRLTFTESNWNVPQSVLVTAVDDVIVDGTRSSPVRFRIVAAETTPTYRNAAEVSVSVSTIDNERPGIVVTPTNGSTIVAESGVQDTLNVSLNAQPLTDVWLTILPTLPADVITLTFYLKFTPENWQTPQSVILSSVNDAVVDGNVTSAIQIFVREDSDPAFLAAPLVSVPVTSIDNEVAALIVTETGGSTLVSETRTTDTFSVRLSDLPNGTVRVLVTSMDLTEGTVSPAELTFTPQNWNTPQQVTVTGVDDSILDGHISFAVRLVTSSDSAGGFKAINGPNVTVVNRDDELPTVTIIEPATTTPLQQPVIRWTSSPEASSYQIWISKKTTPGTALINTVVTGNSFVPTSALGIGRFTSWVRIIHADGRRGQWSVARDFQINTPAVLDAMPRLVNSMRPEFRWQPLPGAAQYEIWLANRTTGQSPVIRQSNLRSTGFTPTVDLTLGTYAVWVRGIDSEGVPAAWSQGIEFRAAAAPVLTAPLTPTFENRPEFRWNPVAGATGYDLFFRNKVTLIENRIFGIAGTRWTSPTDLVKGPYEWWVRASGTNGVTGLWSPTGSFEVGGRPTILSATGTNDRRLSLSWTSVVGAGSFAIQVDRIDVAQSRVIRTTITAPQTTFTSTPLAAGRYRIWIQAISTTGTLSAWSQSVDVQIG